MNVIKLIKENPQKLNETQQDWAKRLSDLIGNAIKPGSIGRTIRFMENYERLAIGYTNEKSQPVKEYVTIEKSSTEKSGQEKVYHGTGVTSITDEKLILKNFLEKCKVNLNEFFVDRYTLNAWDVTVKDDGGKTFTNYQIKVFLKAKEKDYVNEGFNLFLDNIPKFKYPVTKPKNLKKSGFALEVAPLDAHFGKLAWEMETGRKNYDLNIAKKDYEYAVYQVIDWARPFKPEKIFYVIGQDLFHMDNIQGRTTNGNHDMDVDGRIPKIFDAVFEIVVKSIYTCREIAPTEIIWIPGNHDFMVSYLLCKAIDAHFKDDEHVIVDLGKTSRKARLWGSLLVGWTHRIVSRQEAWVNELPHAYKELWAKSDFREWHFGDQHKKKETKMHPVLTVGGVTLRQLTALSEIDKWHYENLFTDAVAGGEAFVWSKDCGVVANFTAWSK